MCVYFPFNFLLGRENNIQERNEKFKEVFGHSPKKESQVEKKKMKVKKTKVVFPARRSPRIAAENDMHSSKNSNDVEKVRSEAKKCSKPPVKVETFKFKIKNELSEPSTENFPCNQCDKMFKFNNSLMKHVKAVHNATIYTCNICYSSFAYLSNLKRHEGKEHNRSIVRYHCNECVHSFTYKHNLKTHIEKFHEREM